MNNNHHHAFDIGAIALTIGSFAGVLPYFASALAVLWYCILIYDRLVNKKRAGDP